MATRTAKEWTTEAATSTNMNKMAGGWVGDASNSSDQSGITTTVDVSDVTVTVTANTSRRLKITVQGYVTIQAAAADYIGRIQEDGTNVGTWAYREGGTTNDGLLHDGFVTRTPSAGTHTYKATVGVSSGSGTLTVSGTGSQKARILVEDVGPAT